VSNRIFDCDALDAVAAELALGILSATDRAAALEHLAGCNACRTQVEELSVVADALLLTGPEREPPPGFETRVLEAMGMDTEAELVPARRAWPRRGLAAAAAVVALAGGVGAFAGRRTASQPSALARQYVAALHVMGGSALEAARLHTAVGWIDAGEVFAYQGRPSWLFVSVRDSAAAGDYTVQMVMQGSRPVTVGHLHASGDRGSLGTTIDVDVTRLLTVQVVDAAGVVRYSASFAGWLPTWSSK
jgi:hypothetical protein